MRQTTCSLCQLQVPVSKSILSDGETYCEACARAVATEAKREEKPVSFTRQLDPTVCARCAKETSEDADWKFYGALPFCDTCGPLVSNWPYPNWLKLSLAGLLVLLAIALIHGRKYFEAGKNLYIGEEFMQEGEYAKALPYLQKTLAIAPNSDKAALLAAKAALKIGDVQSAGKALLGHNGGKFEDGSDSDFVEVNGMWNRATDAVDKLDRVLALSQTDGKEIEANKLMHEAAAEYPEFPPMATLLLSTEEGEAYARKDFDRFLQLAQNDWQKDQNSMTAAMVASALACKYAVSNDPQYKQQAESFLAKAEELSKTDEASAKQLAEYKPRIEYRLKSREIIGRNEFDRRFRGEKTE